MTQQFDGQYPGWTGHVQSKITVTPSNSTAYSPPLRILYASAGGDVVFSLSGDDLSDVAKKVTRTLAAGESIDQYAIGKVWATGTTATVEGYR